MFNLNYEASLISNESLQNLAQEQFFLMENWKWLSILTLILIGFALKYVTHFILVRIQKSSALSQGVPYFARLLLSIDADKSFGWIFASALWLSALPDLELHKLIQKPLTIVIQLVLAYYVIKTIYLFIEAGGRYFETYVQRSSNSIDGQFINLTVKTLKIFVVILGILISLQNFGVNVMSIIAGLGLGGLALALAAQDTAANLFGSITIIFDKPFKVGDWIKVGSLEGTVEEIGFRSTRIRSPNASLVTVPNSVMAKENIENLGVRPFRRLRFLLGVTYSTKPTQITQFCEGIKKIILDHPTSRKDEVYAFFTQYADFSLNITVTGFLNTYTYADENQAQQDILLSIYTLAESLQIEFAFPTQTIQIQKTDSPRP